jgi:hypothetical protein
MAINADLGFNGNKMFDLWKPMLYWGQVIVNYKDDPSGAGRCKVYIDFFDKKIANGGLNLEDFKENPENYSQLVNRIPWSNPITPKFLMTPPKVGESVLVLIEDIKSYNLDGARQFIGPIISQNQFLEEDGAINGIVSGRRGNYSGILSYKTPWYKTNESRLGGPNSISNWSVYGDDPKEPENVVINGRKNQDIILRSDDQYDEILLRVGKYNSSNLGINKKLNLKNPGYISMSYYGGENDKKSSINIVGDNINLISHNGIKPDGKGDGIILPTSEPNKLRNLQNLNMKPTVYGDVLWDILFALKFWVENHKHSGGGVAYTPPSADVETTILLKTLTDALGSTTLGTSENGKPYVKYNSPLLSNNIKIN